MINEIKNDAEKRMKRSIETFKTELGKIRTGRAHPSLLHKVSVEYYGNESPIDQVASVNVADARTLVIVPWDKKMIPAIEKAIMNSDLGLNPSSTSDAVRVPMPALTEERRKDLSKVVRSEGEEGRVAVRNIRRDANEALKKLMKDKKITEDDLRRGEDQIQKLTDKFVAEVEELLTEKEKELMAV